MTNKLKKMLFFISVGIILIALIFFINNQTKTKTITKMDSNVTLENGIQVVHMTESESGYKPNSFIIKKGIPVRWEINATTDRSCASALIVPDYKIREFLKIGKNTVEFTPEKIGKINFSCSMRMFTGVFNVVE